MAQEAELRTEIGLEGDMPRPSLPPLSDILRRVWIPSFSVNEMLRKHMDDDDSLQVSSMPKKKN